MFCLSLIEHTLLLPPQRLNLPLQEAIRKELENIFLDTVITKLGLCISIYDIRKIDGGFIFPGNGASTYTVEFRMIIFRPFEGEIIVAKLKESNKDGLRLSLGFFDDILIPSHCLPNPSESMPDPTKRYEVMWIWKYDDGEIIIDDEYEFRFRVTSVEYPQMPLEQPEKPFAPMRIIGTIDGHGLGHVSWW